MNSLQVRGWPETQKVPGQDKARGQNGQLQGRPSLGTDRCFQRRIAGVQLRQDPGGTLRMNGVGKRERERERETRLEGVGRVWQCFIFCRGFFTLS